MVTATRLQFGQCNIPLPAETRDYSILEKFRPALGPTWSLILWVPGAILPGPKHSGHEHDHSFSSSLTVKNEWSCPSTPLHAFVICRRTTSVNLLCNLTISWWITHFLPNIFGKVNVQKIHETHFQVTILWCQIEVRKITRFAFSHFRNRFCF
jgi:hypothetical protein